MPYFKESILNVNYYFISIPQTIQFLEPVAVKLIFKGMGSNLLTGCETTYLPHTRGSFIDHVDRFLNIFDPPPPLWTILLNKAYVVTWTFGKLPLPLPCPHGL